MKNKVHIRTKRTLLSVRKNSHKRVKRGVTNVDEVHPENSEGNDVNPRAMIRSDKQQMQLITGDEYDNILRLIRHNNRWRNACGEHTFEWLKRKCREPCALHEVMLSEKKIMSAQERILAGDMSLIPAILNKEVTHNSYPDVVTHTALHKIKMSDSMRFANSIFMELSDFYTDEEIRTLPPHELTRPQNLCTVNITGKFSLGIKDIDTDVIALAYPDVVVTFYNIPRFKALTFRIVVDSDDISESVTMRLYHTNKVVIAGARTKVSALLAAHRLVEMLQKIGIPCRVCGFQTQNRVFTISLGFPVDVDMMSRDMPERMVRNVDFPARTYRRHDDSAVVQLYTSGNGVLVGANTDESAKQLFAEVFRAAKPYQPKNLLSSNSVGGGRYDGRHMTMQDINRSLRQLKSMNLYNDDLDLDLIQPDPSTEVYTPKQIAANIQHKRLTAAQKEESDESLAIVTHNEQNDREAIASLFELLAQ